MCGCMLGRPNGGKEGKGSTAHALEAIRPTLSVTTKGHTSTNTRSKHERKTSRRPWRRTAATARTTCVPAPSRCTLCSRIHEPTAAVVCVVVLTLSVLSVHAHTDSSTHSSTHPPTQPTPRQPTSDNTQQVPPHPGDGHDPLGPAAGRGEAQVHGGAVPGGVQGVFVVD